MSALAPMTPLHAAGPDRTYVVGASGWVLERFERDVAILRASIDDAGPGSAGSLILSCEGRRRRLTVILPKSARAERDALATAGKILVRPLGPSVAAHAPVVSRTAGSRPDALIVQDDQASVADIARMVLARPAGLDILLHTGMGLVTLHGLTALRLAVSSRETDGIAFRDFATTCEYGSPRP